MSFSDFSTADSPLIVPALKQAPPAALHDALAQVDTPALLLDLDLFDSNMARVHGYAAQAGVAVRAHGKAHKSPDIALHQIAAGAVGICCQKVSEAEVFVQGGVRDVLVTNQIVGARKVARLLALTRQANVATCVDHADQVEPMAAMAKQTDSRLRLLIELDIGHGRCGVTSPEQALALVQSIAGHAPYLSFGGIHAFRGSAQHMRQPEDRQTAVQAAVLKIEAVVALLKANGFACDSITGGGTGTYQLEADSQVYTEVQPGSYVLMDGDYGANHPAAGEHPLGHALTCLCSVISVQATHAVLDGGLKTFAVDQGLPRLLLPGWRVKSLSDEHTIIVPEEGGDAASATPVRIGQKLQLIPGHCDPTVNLHDWLVGHRGGRVETLWPVSARGALF